MSTKRRTYSFNWFDRLYYIGRGSCQTPSRWPKPFEVLFGSILMWPLVLAVIFWASSERQRIVCMALYIVVILLYDWPLEKYRFTPERARAYFRRYPGRAQCSVAVLFLLPIAILLANIALLGIVVLGLR